MDDETNRIQRKKRNAEIVRQLKNGTWVPPAINTMQSWYPDRGKIKKISNPLNLLNTRK